MCEDDYFRNQYGKEAPCNKEDIDAEIKTPEFGVLVPEVGLF